MGALPFTPLRHLMLPIGRDTMDLKGMFHNSNGLCGGQRLLDIDGVAFEIQTLFLLRLNMEAP